MEEIKVAFLGDGGVGKTTYINKILTNNFLKTYVPTLGVEVHPFEYNGKHHNIFDFAGQEMFSIQTNLMNDVDHAVLFYDNKTSFHNLKIWEEKILNPDTKIHYIRTKFDIPKRHNFSKKNETMISTKEGINLLEIFDKF